MINIKANKYKLHMYVLFIIELCACVVGSISIISWSAYRFVTNFFGKKLTYEQILWAVKNPANGIDINIFFTIALYAFVTILGLLVWNLGVFNFTKLLKYLKTAFSNLFLLLKILGDFLGRKHSKYAVFLVKILFLVLASLSLFNAYKKINDMLLLEDYFIAQKEGIKHDYIKQYLFTPPLQRYCFS